MVPSYFSWAVTIKPLERSQIDSPYISQPSFLILAPLYWNSCDDTSLNINNFPVITASTYLSASLPVYIRQVMLVLPSWLMQMPRARTPCLTEAVICFTSTSVHKINGNPKDSLSSCFWRANAWSPLSPKTIAEVVQKWRVWHRILTEITLTTPGREPAEEILLQDNLLKIIQRSIFMT